MFPGQPTRPPTWRGSNTQPATGEPAAASAEPTMAGQGITADPDHLDALRETESNTVKCVPDYRNRIKHIIKFWAEHYPEYYGEVVFNLSPAQRADRRRYHTATQDLHYDRLNPELTKLYLSGGVKKKKDGKHYGFEHVRKYHDAILYCSKLAKQDLPRNYLTQMKQYIQVMKKEKANAKGQGEVEEQDADEIPFALFESLCEWSIKSGNIMVWAFTTLQWNCIGRSVNVDPLGFHNLSRVGGSDAIVVTYDTNKKDPTGENTSPKQCYSNPTNPTVCMFLSLGCFLSINRDMYTRKSDKIFRKKGKDRSASASYCQSLRRMIESDQAWLDVVYTYVRKGHFHPHGTRKGAAVHVTTGTMDPPPIPSILRRGEWSMGKVLEVYWKWAQVGDTYLGRCVAGLDPDSESFDVLPPHFTMSRERAMKNKHIKEAMFLCFGPILDSWGEKCAVEGILLPMLASIIYHSEFLLSKTVGNSGHPFLSIPILQQTELLRTVKELVTTDEGGEMKKATGVPRHVKMMKRVVEAFDKMDACMEKMEKIHDNLHETIGAAINAKAAESGHVTAQFVLDKLSEHAGTVSARLRDQMKNEITEALRDLDIAPRPRPQPAAAVIEDERDRNMPFIALAGSRLGRFQEYTWGTGGRRSAWAVPHDFSFPAVKLRAAWMAYLFGFPNNRSQATNDDGSLCTDDDGEPVPVRTPIRPLRFLTDDLLPLLNAQSTRVRKTFRDAWRPVLHEMHDANRARIANTPLQEISHDFLQQTFDVGVKALQEKYPELFSGRHAARSHIWAISTWNQRMNQVKRNRRGVGIN